MRNALNQKTSRDKEGKKRPPEFKLPHGYNKKLNEIEEADGEKSVDSLNRFYIKSMLIFKKYKVIMKMLSQL